MTTCLNSLFTTNKSVFNLSRISAPKSALLEETSFSSPKYCATALAVGTLALGLFSAYPTASIALTAIASWSLWSAVIVVLNKKAAYSFFEKPIHYLYAWTMEVNSGIKAATLFPHTFFSSYHTPKANHSKGTPILMVNGYLSFGSTWEYQRKQLEAQGLGPIYTLNVGSGNSIESYANQVGDTVKQIQKETGTQDLTLIGHSKGGLVCSYYATCEAEKQQAHVKDVITIASPLQGTSLAYIGFGEDAREMRPGSSFLVELSQKINSCAQTRFSCIASETDAVVPLSSALLNKNGTRQFVVKDMGHLGIIFSSRVAHRVSSWLKTD